MQPFFQYEGATLYVGDAVEVLKCLPDESVHMICTSPPYWNLRDYQTGSWAGGDEGCDHKAPPTRHSPTSTLKNDGRPNPGAKNYELQTPTPFREACGKCGARRVDRQLGLESTPEEYVENMVAVFREVRRVLRNDGTCWLNIGDSYAGGGYSNHENTGGAQREDGGKQRHTKSTTLGLKPKDLCGIPWLLAFALRADGWYLRSEIIWAKGISFCDSYSGSVMPESCRDRPTKAHEQVFLLTKSPTYFYDQDAIREEARWDKWGDQHQLKYEGTESTTGWMQPKTREELQARRSPSWEERKAAGATRGNVAPEGNVGAGTQRGVHGDGLSHDLGDANRGRNVRDVWAISPRGFDDAHFATFPPALIEPMIKAGTSEKGCCPECGAPWRRVTQEPPNVHPGDSGRTSAQGGVQRGVPDGGEKAIGTIMRERFEAGRERRTLRWEPSCGCYRSESYFGEDSWEGPPPVPCTVLDPFAGAGTVALVSRQLGRHSIGAELNPEYAEIAGKRLRIPDVVARAAEKSAEPTQLVLGGEAAA